MVPEFELFDLGHIATLHRLLGDLAPRTAATSTVTW